MKTLGRILAAATLATAVSSAFGATATTTFTVTANVTGACTVSASNLAFGTYPVNSASNIDNQSTITVNCANGQPYTVGVGTATGRTMTGPAAASLTYSLYSDAARTAAFAAAGTGSGANQNINVYGRIPSGQTPTSQGAFSDTVTVTVTY